MSIPGVMRTSFNGLSQPLVEQEYKLVPTNRSPSEEGSLCEFERMQVWIAEAGASIQSFQQYAFLSALLCGIATTGLTSFSYRALMDDMDLQTWRFGGVTINPGPYFEFGLNLSLMSCIAFSLNTTTLFALSSIYGSKAVAEGNKLGFRRFMSDTEWIRKQAFLTMRLSWLTISTSFFFMLLIKVPISLAAFPAVLFLVIVAWGFWKAAVVMRAATPLFAHSPDSAAAVEEDDEENSDGETVSREISREGRELSVRPPRDDAVRLGDDASQPERVLNGAALKWGAPSLDAERTTSM